jgi:hypothetical protein
MHLYRKDGLNSWGGLMLSPLGTSVTIWPIVPALNDDDDSRAVGGMNYW